MAPHSFAPSHAAVAWSHPALLRLIPIAIASAMSASAMSVDLLAKASWSIAGAAIRGILASSKTSGRVALAALLGAAAILAIVNNQRNRTDAIEAMPDRNETVIHRQSAAQIASMQRDALRRGLAQTASMRLASLESTSIPMSAIEDEGEPSAEDAEDGPSLHYPRAVQTIRFVSAADAGISPADGEAMTKVGAFVAFPGKQAADQAIADGAEWPAVRRHKGAPNMNEVDRYLWEVYQRAPIKRDHSGDFTWKDPAAAKRMGLSLPEYVIGGMDPEFREQLYHAGRAMDAAGIEWSMLSAFRDDYRQKLAAGFKARVGRSLHGGSGATGGYGHGRAIDLTAADGEAGAAWKWIDAHGGKFGLFRPIPGPDPAHIQSRGDWRKLALSLRESRLRTASAENAGATAAAKTKVVAKASW